MHARTHAHAPGHTHERARTHTHTQICKSNYFSVPTMIRERTSILRYTYIDSLVPFQLDRTTKITPVFALQTSRGLRTTLLETLLLGNGNYLYDPV
jgi:hypothetical protein